MLANGHVFSWSKKKNRGKINEIVDPDLFHYMNDT